MFSALWFEVWPKLYSPALVSFLDYSCLLPWSNLSRSPFCPQPRLPRQRESFWSLPATSRGGLQSRLHPSPGLVYLWVWVPFLVNPSQGAQRQIMVKRNSLCSSSQCFPPLHPETGCQPTPLSLLWALLPEESNNEHGKLSIYVKEERSRECTSYSSRLSDLRATLDISVFPSPFSVLPSPLPTSLTPTNIPSNSVSSQLSGEGSSALSAQGDGSSAYYISGIS